MDKRGAEKLYDSGKNPTVSRLLEYDAETKKLKRENTQLKKNSKTSSKPPSSDGPKDKEPKSDKKKDKKRKPGGQFGHKGTMRSLIPVDKVDKIIPHYPDKCDDCGKKLPQSKKGNVVGDPIRKQVTEIPPIKPTITEHQYNTVECTCGCQTTATVSPEISKSSFGPRLTAIIAYLTAVLHVSRRGNREFCETLLNVPICLGSIQNLLEDTSKALESPDKELKDALPEEPVINADETSWNDRWLWIFVTTSFIYFHVAKSRASTVLTDIFGSIYNGILCVDRWGAYTKFHKGLIQFCWAHLKRDFLGILKEAEAIESKDAIIFAKTMDELRKRLMAIWHKYKSGKISRSELIKKIRFIKSKMKRCLKDHISSGEKCARIFAKNLLRDFDNLFTFIYHEGVEPTNNTAERGIRPAVQWRKICFGNRSDNGAVLTSRLLTITRTCWLQKRNPLEFLVDAITAKRANQLAPSLLIA